ncbi:MAG: SPOR domain-containing protein [Bacteroidota bacterium]
MNNTLEEIICDLIHRHDCVIVPGLGGFVSRTSPAYIENGSNRLIPPQKSVLFNVNLSNNDGLLANQIIAKNNLTYQAAVKQIHDFVSDINLSLSNNSRKEIDHVGTFYLDKERNIQFESAVNLNFLAESFGLKPVSIRKVENTTKIASEPKADRKNVNQTDFKTWFKTNTKTAISLATVCLIVGFMIAVSLSPKNSFLAGLNPFLNSQQARYTSKNFHGKIENFTDTSNKHQITINQNGTGSMSLSSEENIVFVYVGNGKSQNNSSLKQEILSKTNPYSPPSGSKDYEIIIGCFRDKSNAERMTKQAVSNNFSSRIIGKNEKNLYVVSAGGYNVIDDAASNLNKVRSHYADAWVLKK